MALLQVPLQLVVLHLPLAGRDVADCPGPVPYPLHRAGTLRTLARPPLLGLSRARQAEEPAGVDLHRQTSGFPPPLPPLPPLPPPLPRAAGCSLFSAGAGAGASTSAAASSSPEGGGVFSP